MARTSMSFKLFFVFKRTSHMNQHSTDDESDVVLFFEQ